MNRVIEREPAHGIRSDADRRHRDEADTLTVRIVGAGSVPGRHLVSPESDPSIVREITGPKRTFAPGSIVTVSAPFGGPDWVIVQEAPAARSGGSLFAPESPAPSEIDAVGVQYADPNVWTLGTQSVTFVGYGFDDEPLDDIFLAVWDSTAREYVADPYAEISDFTRVSPTEITVTVNVLVPPPAGYNWGVLARRSY